VRDIYRSVRVNIPFVRAKIDLCGHFSIRAGKKQEFDVMERPAGSLKPKKRDYPDDK
jgi:hypothetical protein